MRKPHEIINSPTGLYKLEISFNENQDDKTKYRCIILTLLDSNYREITTLQTGASNFQKWAIAWYPGKDTIILNSSDIGTFAYHLTNNYQIDPITLTRDIDSVGDIIFLKKYSNP